MEADSLENCQAIDDALQANIPTSRQEKQYNMRDISLTKIQVIPILFSAGNDVDESGQ